MLGQFRCILRHRRHWTVAGVLGLVLPTLALAGDPIQVPEDDPVSSASRALLSSSAPTNSILERIGKFKLPATTENLLETIEALRKTARERNDLWAPWGATDLERFPEWWVPRRAGSAALKRAKTVQVELRLVHVPSSIAPPLDANGGVALRELKDKSADVIADLGKRGINVWPAPVAELWGDDTVRFSAGWNRALAGESVDGIGSIDTRSFEGIEISLAAHFVASPEGPAWSLDVGVRCSAIRRPTQVVVEDDNAFLAVETVVSTPPVQRLHLETEQSNWLFRVTTPTGRSTRSDYFLVSARIVK